MQSFGAGRMKTEISGNAPSKNSAALRVLLFLDGPLVKWFVIFFYGYFFAIILAEVMMRHFFNHSTSWGEMTARYSFVYFAYVAAAEAFRYDEHIRIDYVPNLLGRFGREILETYIDILCIAISVCVIWYSIVVMDVQLMANIRMHALPINMAFAEAALPIGWSLMIIRILQRMRRRFFPSDEAIETSGVGQ